MGISNTKNISTKIKRERCRKRKKYYKKIQEYEQKYDFINKALVESVAQITEMTKPNHSAAASRVKSAEKMVMLPPLFDGTKPEVAKQHYERFNQYIKFQTKSGNIRDPIGEAIELFEHTLDKKALVWFQEHNDKFVDLTTLKTMFLRDIIHGVRQKEISCNHGIFLHLNLRRQTLMNI